MLVLLLYFTSLLPPTHFKMTIKIFIADTQEEIHNCFDTFNILRPQLEINNFISQVKRQQDQGYKILALSADGSVCSIAGFRISEYLAWGKILYIDDLSTIHKSRRKGFAEKLLLWLIDHAKSNSCHGIHLDTGHQRHNAHKLYLKLGFQISSHHMSLGLINT